MSNTEDYMKDLNNWADMYEKACSDGIFGDAPKPYTPSSQTGQDDFFGMVDSHPSPEIDNVDASYWDAIYNDGQLADPSVGAPEELLQESVSPEKFEKLKDHPASKKALSPNPVDPETVGKDQRRKVTPNWTEGEELEELDSLKRSLYDLECKLSGKEGLLENNEKIVKKLDSLKIKIDELSQELIPTGWKDTES